MPKPDLMPLTGGYRKTPVQIGADIYCDSQLIMMLERRLPTPSFLPKGREGRRGRWRCGSTARSSARRSAW